LGYNLVHRTPHDAEQLDASGAERLPFDKGLFRTTSASAAIESPPIETPAPFDDLVGSWNAELPKGSRLEMQARARVEGRWTAWYSLGSIDGGLTAAEHQEDADGYVDVDTLKLRREATAFQYRFLLRSGKKPAVLRLAAVAVSDGKAPPQAPAFDGQAVELKLKPRSQMDEPEDCRHDICSPTSLSMVLSFWGVDKKTLDVAELVRLPKSQTFGHWSFNVAVAAALGLEGWVARLDGLSELEREIAAGRPVVCSVTFGDGELTGAPLKKTKGHLLVVCGFAANGDVVAMDPAAPKSSCRRVYARAEFHRAWRVNKRGLAYLLGPKL
jgi:hypothetical protein